MRLRLGPIDARHRGRISTILEATRVFRPDELAVALELFDEATGPAAPDQRSGSRVPATLPPTNSDYVFLGAFTPEDELVGYACYGPTPGTDRTWDLYWIAVHPGHQGHGSGTTLLSEVERRLQGLQARLLVVETSSRSEYAATRAFYRARGYAEAARVREFYGPADDRIILSKRFHSPAGRGA